MIKKIQTLKLKSVREKNNNSTNKMILYLKNEIWQ